MKKKTHNQETRELAEQIYHQAVKVLDYPNSEAVVFELMHLCSKLLAKQQEE